MYSHRKLTLFSLALLFLVMQAVWLAHYFGHGLPSEAEKETTCELCLGMRGAGAALPSPESTVAAIAPSEHWFRYAPIIHLRVESIQPRQQGPPDFS